jgi:hypothetical protein
MKQEAGMETAEPDLGSLGNDTPGAGDSGHAGQDTIGEEAGTQDEGSEGEKEGKTKRGKGKKGDSEPAIPLGALRVSEGKEWVKVGPDDWRPVIRLDPEKPAASDDDEVKVRIRNQTLPGQKILLGNGDTARFDQSGIAEVSGKEAKRLLTIPGYETV